jgi:hypothetical protein
MRARLEDLKVHGMGIKCSEGTLDISFFYSDSMRIFSTQRVIANPAVSARTRAWEEVFVRNGARMILCYFSLVAVTSRLLNLSLSLEHISFFPLAQAVHVRLSHCTE